MDGWNPEMGRMEDKDEDEDEDETRTHPRHEFGLIA
jgi:hypothetical protein